MDSIRVSEALDTGSIPVETTINAGITISAGSYKYQVTTKNYNLL